jgi:nucleoside-diphosphate-sugar epimerase
MNELVSQVREALLAKKGVGLRIPKWLGLTIGYTLDFFSKFVKKNFPISAIRVKKFTASSEFESAKFELIGFEPPFTLEEGIQRTLETDFLNPDPKQEIFFTE